MKRFIIDCDLGTAIKGLADVFFAPNSETYPPSPWHSWTLQAPRML